ncbi:MAG: hypothetical protein R3E94_09300 [Burkholderiaceae bacterium]
MNRCDAFSSSHTRRAIATTALCATLLVVAGQSLAQATIRQFPPQAIRATMVVRQAPEITMDGEAMRLSPGARVHGVSNTLVLSASLTGQELTVNFVPDAQGQVREIWILNEAEAAEKRTRLGTQHNYNTAAGSGS